MACHPHGANATRTYIARCFLSGSSCRTRYEGHTTIGCRLDDQWMKLTHRLFRDHYAWPLLCHWVHSSRTLTLTLTYSLSPDPADPGAAVRKGGECKPHVCNWDGCDCGAYYMLPARRTAG